MANDASIERHLQGVRDGDDEAVRRLWDQFFERMVHLARARIAAGARRTADEEDVALSAFDSFCRGARAGRFPELADRDGLWRLLLRMTERKCVDLHRHRTRAKRGGGLERGESWFGRAEDGGGIEAVVDLVPTPEIEATFAEELRVRLDALKPDLRDVARARLEGLSVEEIATRLGVARRSIERRLNLIRRMWGDEAR